MWGYPRHEWQRDTRKVHAEHSAVVVRKKVHIQCVNIPNKMWVYASTVYHSYMTSRGEYTAHTPVYPCLQPCLSMTNSNVIILSVVKGEKTGIRL